MNGVEVLAFLDGLPVRLGRVALREAVAFGASVCERAAGNFARYVDETGVSPGVLRDALDWCWRYASGDVLSADSHLLKEGCRVILPNTAVHTGVVAAAAEEAVLSTILLIEAAQEGDRDRVVRLCRLSRDTIDMAVQTLRGLRGDEPDFEERVLDDPLMTIEFSKQLRDLEIVESGITSNRVATDDFRRGSVLSLRGTIG